MGVVEGWWVLLRDGGVLLKAGACFTKGRAGWGGGGSATAASFCLFLRKPLLKFNFYTGFRFT